MAVPNPLSKSTDKALIALVSPSIPAFGASHLHLAAIASGWYVYAKVAI